MLQKGKSAAPLSKKTKVHTRVVMLLRSSSSISSIINIIVEQGGTDCKVGVGNHDFYHGQQYNGNSIPL